MSTLESAKPRKETGQQVLFNVTLYAILTFILGFPLPLSF